MRSPEQVASFALVGLLALQAGAFLWQGGLMLAGQPLSERFTARLIRGVYAGALLLALTASLGLAWSGQPRIEAGLGHWFVVPGHDFHLVVQLDALSVPFLLLATTLCGVVAVFSDPYLHREPGFHRYFLLLSLFGLGYSLTVLAGSMEMLYCSWEFIGLTSALLIGYFHERPGPCRNGLYTFIVYRICDLGLVTAAVTIHHLCGSGDFEAFLGHPTALAAGQAAFVGGLLLVGAMGKAAQLPFSGWLPRAMEGPTPSTAIFYGALSVHAGVYLLLRITPLLEASPGLAAAVVLVGLSTAGMARFVGEVQNDIKCSLAYASMAQVGLIVAEIGLGFRLLPIAHAMGHAVLRSVQFLRAPSLLHEIHEMHSFLGGHTPAIPASRAWLYRLALERGLLEVVVQRGLVTPFVSFCRSLQRADQWLLNRVGGPP
jgi:NAD(P)H-quinone oxidoreductase subunit 5